MTPNFEPVIREICERTGEKDVRYWTDILRMYRNLHPGYGRELRGWLQEPDVLKKCFGEERICEDCGSDNLHGDKYGIYCKTCKSENVGEEAWRWHGQQLVPLSLEDCLQYYKEYLKI